MEKTEHVMLHGNGAEELAKLHHLPFESPEYFYDAYRYEQWQSIRDTETTQLDHSKNKKFGTVGAVALDVHGNVAAATSTGGMTNKRFSRIGDSPIIEQAPMLPIIPVRLVAPVMASILYAL